MYLIKHILLWGAKLPSLVAACPGDGLWWTWRAGGGQEVAWRPRHWSTPKPTWSLSRHLMLLRRMPPHLPPGRGSYPEPRDKVQEGVQHDLKSRCRQELGPQEERARLGVRACVCVCPQSIWAKLSCVAPPALPSDVIHPTLGAGHKDAVSAPQPPHIFRPRTSLGASISSFPNPPNP